MKRVSLLFTFLVNFTFITSSGQNPVPKIDSLMTTYFRNEVFNGAVLVAKKGEVIYKKAFGYADREWNIMNTVDTKFRIASISKSFTALLILQLAEVC
jgi:CubicO group peptidase (beta-lactamase class C family)